MKKQTPIGAHVSTVGGLYTAIERGEKLRAQSIQIFGASPRSWRAKVPTQSDVDLFKKTKKESGIQSVFLHAAYLVNIASASDDIYMFSKQSLIDHLSIAELIGAEGIIFHSGSSKGISREEAIQKEVAAIKEILKTSKGNAKLILENTAGGGERVGNTLEEFSQLFNKAKTKRLGICLDTAHMFEASWFSSYSKKEITDFFSQFDKKIGIDHICAFHINDSKTETGSHNDRHENIGEGKIGIVGFKNFAQEKRIAGIPWILEVPGFENDGPDGKNVAILRKLFA